MNPNAGILSKIGLKVAERVAQRKAATALAVVQERCRQAPKILSFQKSFLPGPTRIISEIKFASPSKGTFAQSAGLNAVEVAAQYLNNGSTALSILTEADHFNGSFENLSAVRKANPDARILMKDFFVDPYQVFEAKALGANAILLIVALLGTKLCAELHDLAQSLGLEVLVEVHDLEELRVAESIGASMIGVNNRNLKTLQIDLETSVQLASEFKAPSLRISESGLSSSTEIKRLKKIGYSGFLIGSSLMQTGQPGKALQKLIVECELNS